MTSSPAPALTPDQIEKLAKEGHRLGKAIFYRPDRNETERQAGGVLIGLSLAVMEQQEQLKTLKTRAETAEKERDTAVQVLLDTVAARGGEACQDWSSWRVGFGRGVFRGYGQTDAQQIVSATARAIGKPDPYAPEPESADVQEGTTP